MKLRIEQNVLLNELNLANWKKKVVEIIECNESLFRKKFGRVVVNVIDHQQMIDFHLKFFNDASTTDVISFAYEENGLIEAEIFINTEFAREYAEENGIPLEEEMFRYLIHGILHAQGYNDLTEEERSIMKEKEDEWLNLFRTFHVKH